MAITIVSYNDNLKNDWDEFVKEADNNGFLFYRNFMEYHSDRFLDCSVLLYDNEKLVGLFPANKKNSTVYSHQGLTYGGVLLKERNKERKILECFSTLLSYYKDQGIDELIYKPIPNYTAKTTCDFEHFVLNLLEAELVKVDTAYVINFSNEISFQQRRKRSYKKGIKNNTVIAEDNEFNLFWNQILIPNLKGKHDAAPVHSIEEINLLQQNFPENIKQINAYINDEIVAGVTLFYFDRTVHCQYISSNDMGRNTGAIDYLFYYLIDSLKDQTQYFSLGTANNLGHDLNIGLGEWKSGWGAEIHANFHYKLKTDSVKNLHKFIQQ
ncbi:MAG: GNAT family N-acetyltransferase [Flavobacteriales bacterium]|nr:GNAT family N-acetyltransferase [Flavobacteriales bacterium]